MKKIYDDPERLKNYLDKQKQKAKVLYDIKKNSAVFKKRKNEHQKIRREQFIGAATTGFADNWKEFTLKADRSASRNKRQPRKMKK